MKLPNLAWRTIVAIFGIPLILFSIYKGGYPLLILSLIINIVSQYEFYIISEKKNAHPLKYVGIAIGVMVTLLFFFRGLSQFGIIFFGGVLVILLIELFRNKPNATLNIATTVFGIIYPTAMFSFLILIRELPRYHNLPYRTGGLWLIVVIITIWICDTAAYFVGSSLGRYKLFQRVSPRKTVEGAVAGFLFSLVTVYIFSLLYNNLLTSFQYLTIGIIVGISSQTGDLIESIFKRDVGIKDSSSILPGHGGFLDRFDAPTFVAPIIYFYLIWLVL